MPDPTLSFRRATSADIPALVELVTAAYRGDASRAGWTTEADLLDGERIDPELLRIDIERPRSRVLIAESDGRMVACAHVAEEGGAGYFGMFSVRPEAQGGGLGKAVLAEAERIVRQEWGLAAMRMTVIDLREDLIRWYERRGYARTGVKMPFPYGDVRYGIPKRPDLRFEVLEKSLWIRVCATSELLPGEMTVAWAGDIPVLVLNYDGDCYALEDRCSHEDYELSAGSFDTETATIECALHGSRFDVRDGRPLCPPAYEPVARYPVKVEDGAVWIGAAPA